MALSRHIYRHESAPTYEPKMVGPAVTAHAVHLYEDESIFVANLSEFVGATLGSGGVCVVIATRRHHQAVNDNLRENGIDVDLTTREGRYIVLDAQETLNRFMANGHPDRQKFSETLEPILASARAALTRPSTTLSAFGEMVAILSAAGNHEAAIELEHLWSELSQTHRLTIRCGYPVDKLADLAHGQALPSFCAKPPAVQDESHISPANADDLGRLEQSLEQGESVVQAIVEDREKEVAHRKVVEEMLRRSEEFTRNIIESSVDCVKVLDLDGRIQYMSPAGQRALEIENGNEILNKNLVDFCQEERKTAAHHALAAARNGGVGCFQNESVLPSGLKKSWDVRITPALGRDGEIERLVAVSRDITELRSAQQLAIQSEKLAAAGRMAATIAHEINNPLEAVTNFIYLAMTAEGLPEEAGKHLQIADRELARVSQIAQQTLGFYRGNSKDRWTRVSDLVRDVLIVYERKLDYKRIQTKISIDPALKVYCRQGELRQALSNLVTNAIDALRDQGTLLVRARVATSWSKGERRGVRITLADNGTGIPPEIRSQVFVPFFTTKGEIGTGIGLWATKTLIEQQDGKMSFRTRQGTRSGTAMSIFLPDPTAEADRKAGS